ncbi:proline-rich transmembrane protein 1-like [Ptychodera flava]|uniref:proline-rich transmembrane protein 1-like n=1 Tax=Ptychodera flava TaxID=63121 RepID=UPI00396A7A35
MTDAAKYLPEQSQADGQSTQYGQPAANGQSAPSHQPEANDQPPSYGQPAPFDQAEVKGQPALYGQHAANAPPYGQHAANAQPIPYGQPATFGQPVPYNQHVFIVAPQSTDMRPTIGNPAPPNYMDWALVSMMLCFLPTGIVATMFAAKVDDAWLSGNEDKARMYSRNAKYWSIATIFIGIFVDIVIFAVVFATI